MLLSSSLALLCTYHLNSRRTMQSCHKCCFCLYCFTLCSCPYAPFSDVPAPPQPPAARVPPPGGVRIFYKSNGHTHCVTTLMALVQTKRLPLLSKVQLPSSKAETTRRPGQSASCRTQALIGDATGHPKLANFSVSLTFSEI